ncbi:MAG: glycosyltransferase family 39 protein [Actinomycetota bacterium]
MVTQVTEAAEPGAGHPPRALSAIDVVVLTLGVVFAVVVRLWLVRTRLGQLHPDEAVVGLMAHRLVHHGELRVFFWGQSYGGTLETMFVAALFRVFGTSIWVLKAAPILLDGVAGVLVFRIGRRLTTVRVAAYAAVVFVCGPGGIIWLSTTSRGFYWATLVLGLAVVLYTLRLLDDPRSTRDWIGLGLVSGLGFWQSPQILYFVVPAAVTLVLGLRHKVVHAWVAILPAIIGALPWLWSNIADNWKSLDTGELGNPHTTYFHRLHVFAGEGLGSIVGLQNNGHWRGPFHSPFLPVALVGIVFLIAARPPWAKRALLVITLVTYPFLFASFPSSWTVGEGRYMLFLLPFLALAFMYAARRRLLQIALIAIVCVLTIGSLHVQEHDRVLAPDKPVPWHNAALIDRLDQLGVHNAFATYWIAYPLTFQTHERIIVAPVINSRFATYDRIVRADPRPAWIFLTGSRVATRFENTLGARGIPYRSDVVGPFLIVLPGAHVVPEAFDVKKIFET